MLMILAALSLVSHLITGLVLLVATIAASATVGIFGKYKNESDPFCASHYFLRLFDLIVSTLLHPPSILTNSVSRRRNHGWRATSNTMPCRGNAVSESVFYVVIL